MVRSSFLQTGKQAIAPYTRCSHECSDKRIGKPPLHGLQRGLFSAKILQKGKRNPLFKGESGLPLTHPAVEVLRLLEVGSAVVDGERVPDDIMVPNRRVIPQKTIPISTESISCQG